MWTWCGNDPCLDPPTCRTSGPLSILIDPSSSSSPPPRPPQATSQYQLRLCGYNVGMHSDLSNIIQSHSCLGAKTCNLYARSALEGESGLCVSRQNVEKTICTLLSEVLFLVDSTCSCESAQCSTTRGVIPTLAVSLSIK